MKQFRIDDSEKDRILNLHESATKRQYLIEQSPKCCKTKILSKEIFDEIPNNFNIDDTIHIISGGKGNLKKDEEFDICFGQGGVVLKDINDFTININLKGYDCEEGFEVTTGA
jgi:hypothetical protein